MKKILAVWMLLAVSLLTCGCGLTFSAEELYCLPKLPVEYTELDNQINAILAEGAEYAAPASGRNIQPVQLEDLDGDGQEEAVAFFRNTSDEKPLKIYIFATDGESYRQTAVIESSGTSIYSVTYSDLNADGCSEILVGWRVTTDLQALVVYSLRNGEVTELLRTNYVRYAVTNLDQDQLQELVVLHSLDESGSVADYYACQDGSLQLRSSARISVTMAELTQLGRISSGTLSDEVPALFVTGVEESAWAITDILAVRNGDLANIVLSDDTGVSGEIAPYRSLYPTDINGDGVTEVPRPVALPDRDDGGEQAYRRIDWCSYDSGGEPTTVLSTYHDIEDGWYFLLPDAWTDQITVSRGVAPDEAYVTFYRMGGQTPQSFLRITAITGSSRNVKAVRGGRFILSRQAETIYTAELLEGNSGWSLGMTEDEVRSAFNLITKEWMYGDN